MTQQIAQIFSIKVGFLESHTQQNSIYSIESIDYIFIIII